MIPPFIAPLPEWVATSQPFKPGQHLGIDYAAPTGTPVACAADGFVRYKATEGDGYGNTLTVEHADGWESRYAHLLSFPPNQGDHVAAGQIIAETGGGQGPPGAGYSTGPHLHYELRQYGTPVDPAPLLVFGPIEEADDVTTPDQMNELATWEWDTRDTVNTHTTSEFFVFTGIVLDGLNMLAEVLLDAVGADDETKAAAATAMEQTKADAHALLEAVAAESAERLATIPRGGHVGNDHGPDS